jgi:hypothetical protein
VKEYFNKDRLPSPPRKYDRSQLQLKPSDKKTHFNVMSHISQSQPNLLWEYSNPFGSKSAQKIAERELARRPQRKLFDKAKVRRKGECPDWIKADNLLDDSLLSVDNDFDPEAGVNLEFEEFTRAIAKYKDQIGTKLVRGVRVTKKKGTKEQREQDEQTFKDLFDMVQNMDNSKGKKYTLKPFEELLKSQP